MGGDVGGFAPYGAQGVFSAVASAGIAFSFFGFRQGVELAGETDNPKRNVPLTMIGSVVLCGIIYVLLQIAFIGAVPTSAIKAEGWQAVGAHFSSHGDVLATFGPLAAIAGILGAVWLAGLLYADAIISPGDTGLIYAGVTARISYAMGRNGNAPAGLAKVNATGVPWVSLILAFAVGCFFFLPFPGWSQLVEFVTNSTVLSFGCGPLVLLAMRKQLPEQTRPFSLGKLGPVVSFVALWSTNLIVYWTGWDTNWKLFLAIGLGYVLMAVHHATTKQRTPALDFRYGWWVLVWFAGLALVSYLGDFPKKRRARATSACWASASEPPPPSSSAAWWSGWPCGRRCPRRGSARSSRSRIRRTPEPAPVSRGRRAGGRCGRAGARARTARSAAGCGNDEVRVRQPRSGPGRRQPSRRPSPPAGP